MLKVYCVYDGDTCVTLEFVSSASLELIVMYNGKSNHRVYLLKQDPAPQLTMLFLYHVQGVQSSESGPNLSNCLRFVREEALQDPRPGQFLLHLLSTDEMGTDVWTLHSQRALHHQTGLPALKHASGYEFIPSKHLKLIISENIVFLLWEKCVLTFSEV